MDRFQTTRLWGIATTYRMWSAATRGVASYAASWAVMADMMSGRRRGGKVADEKSRLQPVVEKPAAAPRAAAKPAAVPSSVIEQSVPEQTVVAERKTETRFAPEMPPAVGSELPPEFEVVHADEAKPASTQMSLDTKKEFTPPQAQPAHAGKKKKKTGEKAANVQSETASKTKAAKETESTSTK